MFNRNASTEITQMQTKYRQEALSERHSPLLPPIYRETVKL
jgi:hypothetical protein